ncbi:hypothetical protein [Actinoallomurus iriomotensis]|uniref:Uncharacterized protein n=1 Tax=Actinoallomurus iriomotensis TaxID=478107 RepID=A0A9W6RGY7_9ACTN|nr:hypothetical protein [Actinoallomurus iriomotensis]GLY75634.1 hypothetical protein Airi01_039010 [Actinoallomurus iriomotensis]
MNMRQSLTAVIERNTTLTGEFTTEPYEAAWAGEARWFVRVLDAAGRRPRLVARTQISPDGLHWCDLDETDQSISPADGPVHSWPATGFGGWLRLRGTVVDEAADPAPDESARLKVLIYLALKA